MEEKESTISGSPENTESGSPTPISFMASGGLSGGGGGVMSAPPSGDGVIVGSGGGGGGGDIGGIKKRRGRPRKYDMDGNLSYSYAAAAARKAAAEAAAAAAATATPPPGFSLTTSVPMTATATTTTTTANTNTTSSYEFGGGPKRGGRGRSSSSTVHLNQLGILSEIFAETAGADFTPHVITVQTGEDVAAKIHALGQRAPRGICVLSANGTISNVTIRQPGSSGGLLTYEGRFEILSLSGSFTVTEADGVKTKSGGLSITLAGPDGRVVGGSVAGWITAANPIQVVVGSFVPNGYKTPKRKYHRESPTAAFNPVLPDTSAAEIPNLQPMLHHHESGPPVVSPVLAHSHSEADDSIGSGHNLNVVSSHNTPEWNNGTEPQRLYPDINVSVPGV